MISRRQFLQFTAAATAAFALPDFAEAQMARRPNILFVFTDQQTISALSTAGNTRVKTPNMDRLAERGVRFEKSYCVYPVCSPSRASMFTSRMPHQLGINSNADDAGIPPGTPTLGTVFREGGYETAYAGKWHVPEPYPGYRNPIGPDAVPGFEVLPLEGEAVRFPKGPTWGLKVDVAATDAAVKFLHRPHDKPFLLVHSILNPHDICGLPRNPDQFANIDPGNPLPPLPANFNATNDEPETVRRTRELSGTKMWTDEQWRRYIGIYYRMVEAADGHVGRILDALEKSGQADNTIVIFTSDHGEMMGAHHQITKMKFYEEAAAVPLIVHVPGVTLKAAIDGTHLVSGLDLMPTMCDYAGITPPKSVEGRSLRPLVDAAAGTGGNAAGGNAAGGNATGNAATRPNPPWRDYLVSELFARGPARMVRSARYKFITYQGDPHEQFFDLQADSGETHNLIADAASQAALQEHRKLLAAYCREIGDKFLEPATRPATRP